MDTDANPLGIKRLSAPPMLSAGTVLRRAEIGALCDAGEIIDTAHSRAREIIAQAEFEAEKIRSQSRQAAERQVWQVAEGLLEDLRSMREQMAEQSVEVAQTILQRAWEILVGQVTDRDKLHCALKQAERYFVATSAMQLRVNPEKIGEATEWLDKRRNQQAGLELLTVEADISVRPDGVRLYLDRGGVIRADFVGTLDTLKAQWT